MAQPSFLTIENVSKRFGAVVAVDGVSLAIREGEFFSLLGPSGCGKTTLLKMLGGFERPTSGRIVIDGLDATYRPPHRRPTNMVFQSYAVFPHLNVARNIAYGLRNRGLSRAESMRRVQDALALIELNGFEDRSPQELSGGQLQRVALARALVMEPKILLLDEPLSALDKRLRERMQVELRQIQRRVGVTFLFVTHDQEEALTMSDRVAVMGRGRVLQVGTPREIYRQPCSRNVAEFVGTMNFLTAQVTGKRDAGDVLSLPGLGEVALKSAGRALARGDTVVVAVRPECVHIATDEASKAAGSSQGTISAVTFFGERIHYRVDVPGMAEPIIVSARVQQNGAIDEIGTACWLAVEPSGAIVLRD